MDALEKLLLKIMGIKKTPIGKLDPDTLYEHQKVEKLKQELSEKIRKRIEEHQEKMRQDLHDEFDPLIEEMNQLQTFTWEKTYAEVGIAAKDQKQRYQINRVTGEIYKVEHTTPGGLDDTEQLLH